MIQDCGFENSDEFADYVRALTNRDVNLEVTDSEIQQWSDQFMEQQVWRIESIRSPLRERISARFTAELWQKYIKNSTQQKKYKKRNFMENRYKHS